MAEAKEPARGLEWLYVGLGVLGLVGSWAQVPSYLGLGLVPGNVAFWKDTVVNPASTFLFVDVIVLGAVLFVWMFTESRRLGIRAPWVYFLGSLLIAISFAFPLFMAHRQRVLRRTAPGELQAPAGSDWIAVVLVVLLAIAAVAYSVSAT